MVSFGKYAEYCFNDKDGTDLPIVGVRNFIDGIASSNDEDCNTNNEQGWINDKLTNPVKVNIDGVRRIIDRLTSPMMGIAFT